MSRLADHLGPGDLPRSANDHRAALHRRESILKLLSAGMTIDAVLADSPDPDRDDILAALEFGARAAGGRVVPLSAT
jgi:Protein of unknown function (DUF433)